MVIVFAVALTALIAGLSAINYGAAVQGFKDTQALGYSNTAF